MDLTGTEPANALVLASRRMAAGQTNDYSPTIGGTSGTAPPTMNSGFASDPQILAGQSVDESATH
jgi:hypothetical protein